MNPAEYERKGDKRRDHDPHMMSACINQRVKPRFAMKRCSMRLWAKVRLRALRVRSEPLTVAEELPAAPPVDARSGPPEPHRVTEYYRAEGDDARYRIPEQRRIVMFKVARPDDD